MADLRETSVEFITGDSYLVFSTNEYKYINRARKLMEAHPNEVEVVCDDPRFGITVRLPVSWFQMPRPKRKGREMTDEERAQMSARLKEYRDAKSST